jgi:hypothetical protein
VLPCQQTPIRRPVVPIVAFQRAIRSGSALRYGIAAGTLSRVAPNASGRLIIAQLTS